ncbi:unnamed protein product [Schistocephalus solidus]|uniref:C2H2-type domain-containing protein n=1 Tax=Schistocephalus solidus TaxID=70667 RepID=A0A183T9S8_SCHSO|nr:unnamed protein product [Schistocephalus solidus]
MTTEATGQTITGVHTFDLPAVWISDIALWLRTVASRFALRQLTRADTKLHYVLAAVPMDITTDLSNILDSPPTEALISHISLSTQKLLQCLISEEDLGDRKPTQLLSCLDQPPDGQKFDGTMFKQLLSSSCPPLRKQKRYSTPTIAKANSEARKFQLFPPRNPNNQLPLPCQWCQRKCRAKIGLIRPTDASQFTSAPPRSSINKPCGAAVVLSPASTTICASTSATTPAITTSANNLDAPSNIKLTIANTSDVDSIPTCPHCTRTFTSRISLVDHLRSYHTETDEPVPGSHRA